MKLAEAAHILGISLEDVTVDSLNKTYKKLVMAWDPDKCKDPSAKQKYMQINEAYKKLSSVMEGKDVFRGGEQHEIATLMRMFMDMVGMSENDSLPTAALTFGMMFDSHQHAMEEWSTDEDGEEGEYDEEEEDEEEEDDEDEYLQDEYYEEYPQLTVDNGDKAWEPQAKTYSNMNLKDQVSRARLEGDSKLEEEKKLKQAKKRAEKRKKQKEKKLKEAIAAAGGDGSVDEDIVVVQTKKVIPEPEKVVYSEKELDRIISQQKHRLKEELVIAVQDGKLEIVDRIVTYNFPGEMPAAAVQAITDHLKQEIPSYQLLHKCITDFTVASGNKKTCSLEDLQALNKKKIVVLQRLLTLRDPMLDLNGSDESGLSILHKSISLGDIEYTKVIVQVIAEGAHATPEKPLTLNLNSRCHKKGWAPIHYAVEKNNVEAIKVLAQFGANLQATSATDKRLTPMELAKSKLKLAGSNPAQKAAAQNCIDELNRQIALQKAQSKKASTPAPPAVEAKDSQPSNAKASAVAPSSSSTSKNSGDAKPPSLATPEKIAKESPANSISAEVKATVPSSDKKKKKNDKKSAEASTPNTAVTPGSAKKPSSITPAKNGKGSVPSTPSAPVPVIAQEISVASRDEMVDRLLAMGFREADCLAAIARYGTDLDQAISWLVERPVVVEAKPKVKEEIVKVVSSETSEKAGESENSLQQKKEELRRINRAWNAKAEDEKRKLEQQRKLEEAKAKEVQTKSNSKHEDAGSHGKGSGGSSHSGGSSSGNNNTDSKMSHKEGKDSQASSSGTHSNKQQHQSQQSVYSAPTYVVPPGFVNPAAVDPLAIYGGDPNGFYSSVPHTYGNIPMHGTYPGYVYDNTQYGQQSSAKGHSSNYAASSTSSRANDSSAPTGQTTTKESPSEPIPEVYLTGAIELSAGAKPFVPKSFTPSSLPPPAPLQASSSTPTLPSTPSSNSLSSLGAPPLSTTALSSSSAFSSALLPPMNVGGDNGVVSSILPGIGGSASSFMSGLGSSALGGSAGSLSSLDNSGLGLGASSLWSSAGSGLTGGLVSSSLGGDPFGSLSSSIAPNFLSSILGPDLGLDTQDHFDFDTGNGYIPDLDSLLSTDGLPEFK